MGLFGLFRNTGPFGPNPSFNFLLNYSPNISRGKQRATHQSGSWTLWELKGLLWCIRSWHLFLFCRGFRIESSCEWCFHLDPFIWRGFNFTSSSQMFLIYFTLIKLSLTKDTWLETFRVWSAMPTHVKACNYQKTSWALCVLSDLLSH
jgi:hypothetical protein